MEMHPAFIKSEIGGSHKRLIMLLSMVRRARLVWPFSTG